MLRFSRRETLLLTLPPLALAVMILRSGPGHPASALSAHPMEGIETSDEEAVRAAVRLQPSPDGPPAGLVRRTLRIADRAGKPLPARVRVAFSSDAFGHVDVLDIQPDAEGRLPLDLDGSAWVVLSVQAPGCVPRWQPPVAWSQLRDDDLSLELAAASRVEGSSRWADGRPMSGVRLAFRPVWTPGEYSGQLASRLKIVDEEVLTDPAGRFSCTSLRPGGYRVAFPDHPKWPPLEVRSEDLAKGTLSLRAPWQAPASK